MLAPIVFLLDTATPRRAFALAWLYSATFGFWSVRWVIHALVVEYDVAALPAWTFTSILVFGLALVPATAGAAYAALRPRLRGAAAPLAFAALWTLGEWVRGALLGMPWLLAAQTVTRWPIAIQVADFGGQYAVSFVLLAISGGLGIAVRRRNPFALAGARRDRGAVARIRRSAARDADARRRAAAARRHRAGVGAAARALPARLGRAQHRAPRSGDAQTRGERTARPGRSGPRRPSTSTSTRRRRSARTSSSSLRRSACRS